MTFRSVLLIAILTVTAGSVLAQTLEKEIKAAFFAHHVELGDVVHNQDAIETVVQALRLSGAQSENFRSMISGRSQEIKNLSAEIQEKRIELHRALEQSSAMEVGTLTLSIQELESRMTAINERFVSAFSNMLTPDQRAAFEGIKAAANQVEAFHATGLFRPKMQHDFVLGQMATPGVFIKTIVEASETK